MNSSIIRVDEEYTGKEDNVPIERGKSKPYISKKFKLDETGQKIQPLTILDRLKFFLYKYRFIDKPFNMLEVHFNSEEEKRHDLAINNINMKIENFENIDIKKLTDIQKKFQEVWQKPMPDLRPVSNTEDNKTPTESQVTKPKIFKD